MPRNIIIKLLKNKDKEKNLETSRKITYLQGKKKREKKKTIKIRFASETFEIRSQCQYFSRAKEIKLLIQNPTPRKNKIPSGIKQNLPHKPQKNAN